MTTIILYDLQQVILEIADSFYLQLALLIFYKRKPTEVSEMANKMLPLNIFCVIIMQIGLLVLFTNNASLETLDRFGLVVVLATIVPFNIVMFILTFKMKNEITCCQFCGLFITGGVNAILTGICWSVVYDYMLGRFGAYLFWLGLVCFFYIIESKKQFKFYQCDTSNTSDSINAVDAQFVQPKNDVQISLVR